jgi:ankyrin repeat protein
VALGAENGHLAVARLLVEKGVNLEFRSCKFGQTFGRTPLSWAAENGHWTVVRLLVEKGAGRESYDEDDRMPLLLAAENGHEMVARLLIGMGATWSPRVGERQR